MNRRRLIQMLLLGCLSTIALSSFASCQRNKSGHTIEQDSVERVDTSDVAPAFPLPAIPMTIQNVDDRAAYFVAHFWDECDFNDPELAQHPTRLEQSLANFLGIASRLPLDKVKKPLLQPLESSRGELFSLFVDLYEKYLFEPNSPFFNEDLYYPIVEWITHSPKASLAQLERAKYRLLLMARNKVGTPAEQFSFIQPGGEVGRLSDMRGKPTLLLFYSPGCQSCKRALEELQQDAFFSNKVQANRLNILFIDAEIDPDEWARTIDELPSFGVKGFNSDGRIVNVPLYDLKASPTLLLLDAKGIVLLKDRSLGEIRESLGELL